MREPGTFVSMDTKTAPATRALTPDMTVNEVIALEPATIAVFNELGVDACCGGALAIADAARDAEIEPESLLWALSLAVAGAEPRS
jgi:regulator of cell morphogenesis and NO signaling